MDLDGADKLGREGEELGDCTEEVEEQDEESFVASTRSSRLGVYFLGAMHRYRGTIALREPSIGLRDFRTERA